MMDYMVGGFVEARAGHDAGNYYVIFKTDPEYVYLVDGRIRTLDRPKKKKKKHVKLLTAFDQTLAHKIIDGSVKNEEIKRAIKLLQNKSRDENTKSHE